jgi:hypothetical protein
VPPIESTYYSWLSDPKEEARAPCGRQRRVAITPWSGQATYRRLFRDWPDAVCAENPFFGTDATAPTAHTSDF